MHKYNVSCGVLGLKSVDSKTQLKSAYYQQIKRWHPDRFIFDQIKYKRALEKIKHINLAYAYLSKLLANDFIPQTAKDHNSSHFRQKTYSPGLPDASVLEIPLNSRHTVSVGYDYENFNMFIKFSNSKVYKFLNIPPTIYEGFLTAEVYHKYAHHNIFFKYAYVAYNV